LIGTNNRRNFKFVIPCISNCAVELFTGPKDNGDVRGTLHVNDIDVTYTMPIDSTVCYLDASYNTSYFYRTNP
jgi:hypothetical protein